jgi:nucleotide-binding universal stress UspA family protein
MMIKLEKVLYPTDFSEASENAQRYAISFAKAFGAKLYLLSVNQPFNMAFLDPLIVHDLDANREAAVQENLDRLRAEIAQQEIEVEAEMRRGSTSLEIVSFAKEKEIDLIIMGTHGWSGLDHVLMGSTAEVVVRKAPCPVLTVRPAVHDFVEV